MKLQPLRKAKFPKAPSLLSLLGPSFILLGLGLGSGEIILWPYLSAHFGLGIIWGAVLGITFQFFINMEISRYTLATGESIFVGLTRKFGIVTPFWFIFSTLIPWMWPGIVASSGTLLAAFLGVTYSSIIPIVLLVLIGVIYTVGPTIYKTQESLQKIAILIGVPFVFGLAIFLSHDRDWGALSRGVFGIGNNYFLFPVGLPVSIFLAALAYAGAGGNLNLGQSLYIKEKGYGMGAHSGKITSLLTGRPERLRLVGTTFKNTLKNRVLFFDWWRKINIEHGVVFWATGAVTMLLLALLSYITAHGHITDSTIQFVVDEAKIIAGLTNSLFGGLFLIVTGVMLFFTEFSVLGTTSRIMTENTNIISGENKLKNSGSYFYLFLWLQIILGVVIFALGFNQPLTLVVVGAILNAFSMFIYSGLVLWLNKTALYKEIRPSALRSIFVLFAFLFYGGFSIFTIINYAR